MTLKAAFGRDFCPPPDDGLERVRRDSGGVGSAGCEIWVSCSLRALDRLKLSLSLRGWFPVCCLDLVALAHFKEREWNSPLDSELG